eukprot:621032-Rhodomonas_salina.1
MSKTPRTPPQKNRLTRTSNLSRTRSGTGEGERTGIAPPLRISAATLDPSPKPWPSSPKPCRLTCIAAYRSAGEHTVSQYRTSHSTIRYLSAAHRIAPYGISVPHNRVDRQRHTLSQYRTHTTASPRSRYRSTTHTLPLPLRHTTFAQSIRYRSTAHPLGAYGRMIPLPLRPALARPRIACEEPRPNNASQND